MSEHQVKVNWKRTSSAFDYKSYNRDHVWSFKAGQTVQASAAPAYRGNPELVDPEDAFVASLSSCHLLTFLAIASRKGLVIDEYVDDAVGFLEKNVEGRLAITRVVLRPRISFSGDSPDEATLAQMHEQSHHECFIANSVKTNVTVESA